MNCAINIACCLSSELFSIIELFNNFVIKLSLTILIIVQLISFSNTRKYFLHTTRINTTFAYYSCPSGLQLKVVTNIPLNEAGSNAMKANSVTMCKVKYYIMRDATVCAK